jgi:hypothetical protein
MESSTVTPFTVVVERPTQTGEYAPISWPLGCPSPTNTWLDRHYGTITETAQPDDLSLVEQSADSELVHLMGIIEKHIALWTQMAPLHATASARAIASLTRAKSVLVALSDGVRGRDTARMCAVVYGHDLALLIEAFREPPASRRRPPAPEVDALAECVPVDRALFGQGLARAISAVRRTWVGNVPYPAPKADAESDDGDIVDCESEQQREAQS